jgi:uncharacterized membrane protein
MNTKSHIGFWLCVLLLTFIVTPVMRDGPSMESFVNTELELTQNIFGKTTGNWLQDNAAVVFKVYMPSASLKGKAINDKDMVTTKFMTGGAGVGVAKGFNHYIEGLVLNLFVMALRFFIFLVWFVLLLPVFIAAIVDGFVQRAIKRAEFGSIRPATYSVMSMIVIPMAMAPLMYLIIPIPVTPLISPIWAFLMILPLSTLVSNTQPLFGKG